MYDLQQFSKKIAIKLASLEREVGILLEKFDFHFNLFIFSIALSFKETKTSMIEFILTKLQAAGFNTSSSKIKC